MRLVRHLFLTASLLLTAEVSTAWAGPPGSPGTITITEKKLAPAEVSSAKELKAAARTSVTKGKEDEGWKVYFVAHMNRAPGAEQVNLVFYDQAAAKGQPREEVQAFPMHTKKDAKIMMADIELKPEEGFKAGGKYNVLVTRLINGKEDIYARTTLELK